MSYAEEENESFNEFYVPANLIPVNGDNIEILPQPALPEQEDEQEKNINNINVDYKSVVPGMTDVYTTEAEAVARAIELGGSGFHIHDFDGEEVFMPFNTHEEYEQAVKGYEEQKKYKHIFPKFATYKKDV